MKPQSYVSIEVLTVLHSFQLPTKPRPASQILECFWSLPPIGYIKINVDGASRGNPCKAGWGAVFRNCEGSLIGVLIGGLGIKTNYYAETMAIINTISKALEEGWKHSVLCF
ncbi:hypothetical protein FRX31_027400 [Thalictrum thalictroides]|uniref:RNase H type-1 domain-containing protein n=1 Tax=Thalictrum thalictroides TaxID=46969 RepID=A0A7J6VFL9_THATH|nr:hypothetical protein FRX31_027400 [Thalictrum thalictroides]